MEKTMSNTESESEYQLGSIIFRDRFRSILRRGTIFLQSFHGHEDHALLMVQGVIMWLATISYAILQVYSEYPQRIIELILQGQSGSIALNHFVFIIGGVYDWTSVVNFGTMFFCVLSFVINLSVTLSVMAAYHSSTIAQCPSSNLYKGERLGFVIPACIGCVISFLLILECVFLLNLYRQVYSQLKI